MGVGARMQSVDYKSLFEATPRALLVLSAEAPRFTVVAATDAYLRRAHKQRGDIVGRSIFDVVALESAAALRASLEGTVEAARETNRGGAARQLVVDASGRVECLIHDVGDDGAAEGDPSQPRRKWLEGEPEAVRSAASQELGELRRRLEVEREAFAAALSQMPMPAAVYQGEGLRLEYANAAYNDVAEGRHGLGKPLVEAMPEFAGQWLARALREVMQSGQAKVYKEVLLKVRRAGQLQDTYWTAIHSPLKGRTAVIVIFYEVTQQVLAQRRFEALAADAERANRAKDEFLAMLGHELRNPLSPIATALQLMRLRGLQSREQDVVERQVGHLIRLVDDLLDVSRITRGKVELKKQRVEIAAVLVRAMELTSPLLEQRRQRVEIAVAREGLTVLADPDRMAQVFANILSNAAKYSEPSSTISVSAERSGSAIRVRIADEGIGLAPGMAEQIFEPFVQERQSLDRARGGLGLGLAIVKSFVEMHGGRVSARSEGLGKGTEFTVELPVAERTGVASPDSNVAPPVEAPSRRSRVLVVDDNEDAAQMLKEALEMRGYAVEVANDGPTALRVARSYDPELALLDIGLPVMDGYELAERLREQNGPARPLHLVAVTGYGQESDRRRSAAAGFEGHLVKPVDLAVLEGVIARLIP